MNISKMVENSFDEEEAVVLPSLEVRESELVKLLECLAGLKNNLDFQYFKNKVLDDAIEIAKERLFNERDEQEKSRLQGFIVSSQQFSDLARLEKIFLLQLEQVKGRLQEQKDKEQEKKLWKNK